MCPHSLCVCILYRSTHTAHTYSVGCLSANLVLPPPPPVSLGVQSWKVMTCAVCAWTMLADSDMSPVYTLPLVLCALVMSYLQVRHPVRDWRKLGKCQKVIQHTTGGGMYFGVAVNSEVLLAVTDCTNQCIQRRCIGEVYWERSAWWYLAWNFI